MTQHYLTYPTNSAAVCGADMVGRRNSRTDSDPAATTCPECNARLDEEADAAAQTSEYMMADEAYDVRGFADNEPSDCDDYVDHGGWAY